ncbi:hypothetical protein [Porphyromonas macacae]|nr:hypothetical protein [Porphyromonas macacae]
MAILLLSLVSCQHNNQESISELSSGETYLSVELKAQTDNSINEDITDLENHVHSLAMIVFPKDEEQCSGFYFAERADFQTGGNNTLFVPATKITKPGESDIYFIVNARKDDIITHTSSRAMTEAYLHTALPFSLTDGAKSNKGFPMARVYYNQKIEPDYTKSNPFIFRPKVNKNKPLIPVSSYGKDINSGEQQDRVSLVRANAKITISISGEGLEEIKEIDGVQLINYPLSYTLIEAISGRFDPSSDKAILISDRPASFVLKPKIENGKKVGYETRMYIPERTFTANTVGWNKDTDKPQNGVLYFRIITKGGHVFQAPIITHTATSGNLHNYLDIAKGKTAIRPDYSVYRNQHYHYNIKIPAGAKELEVDMNLKPWTLVSSRFDFGKPDFRIYISKEQGEDVDVADGLITISKKGIKAKFTFTPKAPIGTLWRASITNGLDFRLSSDYENNITYGIIAPGSSPVNLYIEPLKDFLGDLRYTEFYITINGQEINLLNNENSPGPGNRWLIKQTGF